MSQFWPGGTLQKLEVLFVLTNARREGALAAKSYALLEEPSRTSGWTLQTQLATKDRKQCDFCKLLDLLS
jgi:hypothetical protein